MTSEAKQEVARLLLAGEKTSAIQYLSDTYTISLQDSKLLVETLEAEMSTGSIVSANPMIESSTALDGELKGEVILLLQTKGRIEAVKYVKKTLNIPLKEALMMVGEVATETNPNYVADNAAGCLRGVSKGLGIFFGFVALLFVGSAGVIFYSQTQSIGNSDLVTGQVAEMRHIEEGGSAPVIQFEWKGMKRTYLSNTYSSPSAYAIGQTVSLYVNRKEPEDILIDNFSERYALLVGLGVIGAVLGIISIVFLYFGRPKF